MLNNSSKGPIFIVGMNGSGTTMLRDYLSQHPNIYGFPGETRVLPYFISRVDKYGDLHDDANFHKLWDKIRNAYPFVRFNNGNAPPLPEDWKSSERNIRTIINSIFMYFANKESKRRWCEKTPMHALHINELANIFPTAKFIHIIRDGRACSASFYRRWGYHPALTIFRWKKVVSSARDQGRMVGNNYYEVKYEEITTFPENVMRDICKFIDEPFDISIINGNSPYISRTSSPGGIKDNNNKWQEYFNTKQIYLLERIAGKELAEFGYQPLFIHGDYDLSRTIKLVYSYQTYIKLSINYFREGMGRKQYSIIKRLTLIISRFLGLIKQRITTKY